MSRFVLRLYYALTVPVAIFFRFYNTIRIQTGTSYKSHLAMALKILETPPAVLGDVVECGTWKGGSAANLSLVCRIVGRPLQHANAGAYTRKDFSGHWSYFPPPA